MQLISEEHELHSVGHCLQTKPLTNVPVGHGDTHPLLYKYFPIAQVVQMELELHTSQSLGQSMHSFIFINVCAGHVLTHSKLCTYNSLGHELTQALLYKYFPEEQVVQTEFELHTSQPVEQLLQTKPFL